MAWRRLKLTSSPSPTTTHRYNKSKSQSTKSSSPHNPCNLLTSEYSPSTLRSSQKKSPPTWILLWGGASTHDSTTARSTFSYCNQSEIRIFLLSNPLKTRTSMMALWSCSLQSHAWKSKAPSQWPPSSRTFLTPSILNKGLWSTRAQISSPVSPLTSWSSYSRAVVTT